eukprot:snap_masked-scaffold_4-processed-gene-0.12-mRNA-1 protein AED:1.00 eAED:1.00 QI:0/0/0/0/1/1/4/0/90
MKCVQHSDQKRLNALYKIESYSTTKRHLIKELNILEALAVIFKATKQKLDRVQGSSKLPKIIPRLIRKPTLYIFAKKAKIDMKSTQTIFH